MAERHLLFFQDTHEALEAATLADYQYTLDAVGNRLAVNEGAQQVPPLPLNSTTIAYGYDPLYRLTSAAYTGAFIGAFGYTYDAANRLSTTNGVTTTWDANGNLLADGTSAYVYDQANRLKTVTQTANVYTFAYNGDGARLKQIAAGVPTTYTLDLNTGLVQVLADGTSTYLYGNGRIAQQGATSTDYFLADALGSVRQLAGSAGAVTLIKSYEPYGDPLTSAGTGASVYGFTGEQRDATGLEYLRARYYAPGQGRFVTKDPWDGDFNHPMSYDAWLYVYGNATNLTDPSGRQCEGQSNCPPISIIGVPPPTACGFGQICASGTGDTAQLASYDTVKRTIKQTSARFGLPWQVVGGVLESEILLDTVWYDPPQDAALRYFPPIAELFGNPGPGIGNIHISTAKSVAEYLLRYCDSALRIDIGPNESNTSVSLKLLNDTFSIEVLAGTVRKLADFRFGSNMKPSMVSHANLADWKIVDAVAIWHGYRYGVPGVSPDAQGLGFVSLPDFQDRSLDLDLFISTKVTSVYGSVNAILGAKDSARRSLPIFQKYFAMPD